MASTRGLIHTLPGLAVLSVAIVVGALVDRWLLPRLVQHSVARGWFVRRVALTALSGQVLFWSAMVGGVVALPLIVPGANLIQIAPTTVLAAMLLAATVYGVRFGTTWVRLKLVRRRLDSVSLINNLLWSIGGVVYTYVLLGLAGVDVTHAVALLAGSSVGITLALRDPLANLFSGMLVVMSDKVQPGDYVRLTTGHEGYVIDIRWADTYIREPSNNIIIVPNAVMSNSIVTNLSRPNDEVAVAVELTLPYNSRFTRMERLLNEVAVDVHTHVPGGTPQAAPSVRFHSFNQTSAGCTVVLRARSFSDEARVKHEFVLRLMERLAAEEGGSPEHAPAPEA